MQHEKKAIWATTWAVILFVMALSWAEVSANREHQRAVDKNRLARVEACQSFEDDTTVVYCLAALR